MIPTVLVPAALVGRWWFIPPVALGWAIVVVGTNAGASAGLFFAAAGMAAANAAVGVVFHKAVMWVVRGLRVGGRQTGRQLP